MTGRAGVAVGDVVEWTTSLGRTVGRVVDVAEGLADPEFGPLVRIECFHSECTSCKGGWRGHEGWKHLANTCQLTAPTVEIVTGVTLF